MKRFSIQPNPIIALLLLICTHWASAQTGVSINSTGAAPNANAILDVSSTTKGALLPRMSSSQRTAFVPTGISGMTVYDTTTQSYWYWDGSANTWREIPNTSNFAHNTLDESYDQGGAGAGRTITADAGAVNITGTGGLTVNGNVGVGTTGPLQKLEVIGNISLPSSSGNKAIYTWDPSDANWRIGMSATPGFTRGLVTSHTQFLTFASGAGQGFAVGDNVSGLSAFEVASSGSGYNAYFRGNVGIGTATPDANLNVGNPSGATLYLTREDNTTALDDVLGSLLFDSTDDTGPSSTDASAGIRGHAAENQGNSNKGGYLTFFTKPAGTPGTSAAKERMRIAANGNVGVGNTSPIGPLSVGNSAVSGSDGFLVIGKNDGGGGTRHMRLGFDASFNFVIGDYGNNNSPGTWTSPFKVNYAAPNNSLSISSAGSVTMSSLGSGLVKASSGTLSIATGSDLPSGSTNYIQNQNASDQSANFRISGSGSASVYYVNHGSGNVLEVGDDAWIGDINASNTVGITGQQTSSNGGLRLGTNTSAYLYSDGTANIGVGTSSPGFKLHVNGDIHPDGKIVVQNGVNGGGSRGIWMWTAGDSNWGIYMGQSGGGLSLSGGTAPAGGGFTSHAIRFRAYDNSSNGFIFENSSNVNLLSIRSDNGRTTFRGGVLFDCPSCGSSSTVDGSADWGDLTIQGRVLSTNSNLHLSPPNGYKVVINTTYRAAGGSTGSTGLDIEDGGIRMRKSYYYFQRYCYCGCYGCGSGSYDLGTWDFCAVAQVGFKNNQSATDEDDDVQCAVYPDGYGYGEQTNYTATYTEAYNSRRRWRMYLEAYEDTNGVTCAANCMNFE